MALVLASSFMMTSCYVHEYTIGQGAQGKVKTTKKNHFVIRGLVPIKTAEPKEMANGKKDYNVETKFSLIDMILGSITYGIYTPTTTTVTK